MCGKSSPVEISTVSTKIKSKLKEKERQNTRLNRQLKIFNPHNIVAAVSRSTERITLIRKQTVESARKLVT